MIGLLGPIRQVLVWVSLAAVSLLLFGAGAASASTAQEEGQGAEVLRELEAGKTQCGAISDEDFEHVGDYVMGRMLGSTARHEAMDETMTRMMGATGERQMHEAMGHRFSDCPGGKLPSGFGRMMGAFGAMGMMGGGMMGGLGEGGPSYEGARPDGPSGSMMGGGPWNESSADDNGSDGPSAAAMVGMMAVLIGAIAVAVLLLSRRRPRGPLDTLKRRFAAGEMSSDEYEERRRLLGGS